MNFIPQAQLSGPGRFMPTRGRIQNGAMNGLAYPSPFFDIAHTYLPANFKQLFRYCRYYFLTNPVINAIVFKLAEYPITDVVIEHDNTDVRARWTEYLQDHLSFRAFQLEVGLDYFVYGNAFISVVNPFTKYLICGACKARHVASHIMDKWTFTGNEFRLTCPTCSRVSNATAVDRAIKDPSGVRLLRWNPEDIDVRHDAISGTTDYFYTLPQVIRSDITLGRKEALVHLPQIFIEAVKQQKGIRFTPGKIFHLRRPSIAGPEQGWGIPLLLPLLKDAFYLQIMKKAQETLLVEAILPMRTIFPQPSTGTSDPYCVTPETLVETPDGLRRADEVYEGDFLRSHTGVWRRVLRQHRRPVPVTEKVFKVKVASLAAFPFEASEEHPILAVKRAGGRKAPRAGLVDPSFIEVQQLEKGDYVAYPTKRTVRPAAPIDLGDYIRERAVTEEWVYRRLDQQCAEIYEWLEVHDDPKHGWGERRDLLDKMGWSEANYENAAAVRAQGSVDRVSRYLPMLTDLGTLIGFYLSEGSKNGAMTSFSLHLGEKAFAEQIDAAVQRLGFRPCSHHERPEQNGRSVQLEDVILSEFLHNACGVGFANKRIPDFMSEAREPIMRAMLRSLFDGDGCFIETTTGPRLSLKLANPSMILEARRLILSLGYIGGVMKEEPTETSTLRTTAYQLNYNGEAALRVLMMLQGGEDWHPRPAQKSGLFRGDYVLLRIDEITEGHAPEVIGFQMDEDKSFCVAGVATHNTNINLADWRDHISMEIARWRIDPNYYPILPLPIGTQTLGGDGKALLMGNEMQMLIDQLIWGAGCPREFVTGGMSYSGSQVSMRMLENSFAGYILHHKALLRWIIEQVTGFLDHWQPVKGRFKPFKMADDMQRMAFLFQLSQANKISDRTLLTATDLDVDNENKLMDGETEGRVIATKKQQLASAQIQSEVQSVMMRSQAKLQQEMQAAAAAPPAPGAPGGPEPALMQGGGVPGGTDASAPGGLGPGMSAGAGMGGTALTAGPGMTPAAVPSSYGQQLDQVISSGLKADRRLAEGSMGVDLNAYAAMMARHIVSSDPQSAQALMASLQGQPELYALVVQNVQQLRSTGGAGASDGAGQPSIDMRPLPAQRPPRRDQAPV